MAIFNFWLYKNHFANVLGRVILRLQSRCSKSRISTDSAYQSDIFKMLLWKIREDNAPFDWVSHNSKIFVLMQIWGIGVARASIFQKKLKI